MIHLSLYIIYLRVCNHDFKRRGRETRDLVHEEEYTRLILTRLIKRLDLQLRQLRAESLLRLFGHHRPPPQLHHLFLHILHFSLQFSVLPP
ncbi:hypothetical protein EUTSA_v10010859mg [Eutrema salsugineum]|uniref:Uncharacterized protein n=1 Tax=Eutrema salsugineum TaxID=72664 RepID=V4NHD4_EUTSA|nr:hypothetical protein EUTSA_v10010859mg [Eutrema salsugineum]